MGVQYTGMDFGRFGLAAAPSGDALPVYTVALVLDYLSAALGRLAAWIAGDDWPR